MNFERMPELGHPLGYPFALAALAAMGGVVVVMPWLFRRRGWFE